MIILAIESSCDETSAAVIIDSEVKSNIISSQYFHSKYGGVVPELASRAHLTSISVIAKQALEFAGLDISEINAIAVTKEPGLIGSLVVGTNFAKGLSLRFKLPLIPVNHIEGHLYSGCLEDNTLEFPFISLVVSGGHTAIFYVKSYNEYEIVGLTRDDAAGEAFDKIAKLLGLPYPGGPLIDKAAQSGNPKKYNFPRPMIHDNNFDFSFSGLKTSVRYFIMKNFPEKMNVTELNDICASVQEAIVDVLSTKVIKAALQYNVTSIIIAGGVSSNSGLRETLSKRGLKNSIKLVAPKMTYCVDNAAMIGFLAEKKFIENPERFYDLSFTANSNSLRANRRDESI
jgi:N6-L-threonylcarbamoyladenine synthase